MWSMNTIEWLDIELTSFCNIECKGCKVGYNSRCPIGQKPDNKPPFNCIKSGSNKRLISDCTKNICSCQVVITKKDIGNTKKK